METAHLTQLAPYTHLQVNVFPQQNQFLKSERGDCSIKCEDINERLQETKNQGSMTQPKEHNHFPVTDPTEIEICELPSNSK